jgi:hypothetical protein
VSRLLGGGLGRRDNRRQLLAKGADGHFFFAGKLLDFPPDIETTFSNAYEMRGAWVGAGRFSSQINALLCEDNGK